MTVLCFPCAFQSRANAIDQLQRALRDVGDRSQILPGLPRFVSFLVQLVSGEYLAWGVHHHAAHTLQVMVQLNSAAMPHCVYVRNMLLGTSLLHACCARAAVGYMTDCCLRAMPNA